MLGKYGLKGKYLFPEAGFIIFKVKKLVDTIKPVLLTLVQGMVVRGSLYLWEIVREDCCPRRHWSNETFVQGAGLIKIKNIQTFKNKLKQCVGTKIPWGLVLYNDN